MAEAGGPATQTGIWYQNSVAALYLGDLLDLKPRPQRERVVEVRLEAPNEVDDIVVRHANGHRKWIHVKSDLRSSGKVWTKLWRGMSQQAASSEFSVGDFLVVAIGDNTPVATSLRECCERALYSENKKEWEASLTKPLQKIVAAVGNTFRSSKGSAQKIYEILKYTMVEIIPWRSLERDQAPYRMPESSAEHGRLLSALRDMAGGEARVRGTFRASALRDRLALEHQISILEPKDWGLRVYRDMQSRLAVVEVPGTTLSGPVRELFVWPTARNYDRTRQSDFEDEDVQRSWGVDPEKVDLKGFPGKRLNRLIVMAGPGFGKSMLLRAISDRLHMGPLVPVIIPLTALSSSGEEIADYLVKNTNHEHQVGIDWGRLNESGLTVLLLDGLDELPNERRQGVVKRVELFSARYPEIPWLITVRDPGAVPTRFEAQTIELLPLEDSEIAEFAERWSKRIGSVDDQALTRNLDAYPDLKRLTRIPLFLSILLATWREGQPLPKNRAEIIEVYLRTLFAPEMHKETADQGYDPRILRAAAEGLAFHLIENQEIGGTERSVMDALARLVPQHNPNSVLDQLRQRGILRRHTALRYVFPFPIVQEYLGAHHLVNARLSEVPRHIQDATHRPWAQVVQFALELHPDPAPLVEACLEHSDDAFATGLRLLARCVVNGMKINDDLRAEIGRRLAARWQSPNWSLRSRIGQLLYDGWSTPLLPEVREQLANRWLLDNGGGQIICAQNDPALTRSLLSTYVEQYLDAFLYPHSIRTAIDAISDDAFALYADVAHRSDLSDDQVSGVAGLIEFLDPTKLSQGLAETLALDEDIHERIRLAAFSRTSGPLDPRAHPLIDKALRSDNWRDRSHVQAALARSQDPIESIARVLRDRTLSLKRRRELLDSLKPLIPDAQVRCQFVRESVAVPSIVPEFRDIMLVYAASEINDEAMRELVARIAEVSIDVACGAISLLGWYRTGNHSRLVLDGVKKRKLSAKDAVAVANATVAGMTSFFEMWGYRSGALRPAPTHPLADQFAVMVDDLCQRYHFDLMDRLSINVSSARLGSRRAIDELYSILTDIIRRNRDIDEYDLNLAASDALYELQSQRRLLALEDVLTLVKRSTSNVLLRSLSMLASHGTLDALRHLLELYNQGRERGSIHRDIEKLSVRLGVGIQERKGRLVLEAPAHAGA